MNAEYRLIQGGNPVAWVDGPEVDAYREIRHYAVMYSQDGPVEIEKKVSTAPEQWRTWAEHDALIDAQSEKPKTCGHCAHSTSLEDAGWPKQGDLMECAVNGFLDDNGVMESPDWVMPGHYCDKYALKEG